MTTPELVRLQEVVAGRYSVVQELGRGGMGVVFLARDVALERLVAIKLLPPALAASEDHRRRFLREARAAAGLSHPNIVAIHAVEEHGDLAFFVMTYVEGETLGSRVRRAGPLGTREALRVLQEVAWALGHAHARGIVHRDVKPDNILLDRESGRAIVADFGIAATPVEDTPATGTAIGTPAYMSPQQAAGEPPTPRDDLYALGVTAWFALSGALPNRGGLAPALLAAAPRVPARLAGLVERAMAPDPEARIADTAELLAGLEAVRGTSVVTVAAPLRAFLREADAARREMGVMATAVVVTGGTAAGLHFLASGLNQSILASVFGIAMVLAGAGGAVRLGQVLDAARALRRQGYDHRALAHAARVTREEQVEERRLADADHQRERFEGAGLVAAGVAKSVALMALALSGWGPGWLQALAIVGSVVVPTVTLRKFWSMIRPAGTGWLTALAGRPGKLMLSFAGLGLGKRGVSRPPSPADHTVVAIGADAEALFGSLSPGEQQRLEGALPVIQRLRREVEALHGAGDAPGAPERLATAVAALEAIRLDLLRVRAGMAQGGDLTGQVEAVARLHQALEDRAAAEADVERDLAPRGVTPVR